MTSEEKSINTAKRLPTGIKLFLIIQLLYSFALVVQNEVPSKVLIWASIPVAVSLFGPSKRTKYYNGIKHSRERSYYLGKNIINWTIRTSICWGICLFPILSLCKQAVIVREFDKAGLFIATKFLPFLIVIMLICIVYEAYVYLISDGVSTYWLKDTTAENISQKHIVFLVNDAQIELRRNQKITDGDCYILEHDDYVELFDKKAVEFESKTNFKCYLIATNDQEILDKKFEEINLEYENCTDGRIRVYILANKNSNGEKTLEVPEKYLNSEIIKYFEFKDMEEFTFAALTSSSSRGKKISVKEESVLDYDFEGQVRFYFQNPNRFIEITGLNFDARLNNDVISKFYDEARMFRDPMRSLMALLDYEEMILRLVAAYFYQNPNCDNKISERNLRLGNFTTMGKHIYMSAVACGEISTIEKIYQIPETLQKYISSLFRLSYLQFEGEKINFPGLISLSVTIRNKLVAHGTLDIEGVYKAWAIMFYLTGLLNEFLDIDNFELIEMSDGYVFGYRNDKKVGFISAGNAIIESKGYPCFANTAVTGKEKMNYINYFSGDTIVPQYE